uniref:KIF21A/B second helical domain-containing protein n=1 Tax=Timema shepardi TaxID=629360 RepID=A0A7R9G6H2_TIMSH|nr:unnamed protein product [Timema shepardi]
MIRKNMCLAAVTSDSQNLGGCLPGRDSYATSHGVTSIPGRVLLQVEEIKGGLDGLELGQGLIDVNEARYFIEKLYNMAVSQTYIAAQKELGIKEMEIKLNGITQRNQVQDELFQHVVRTQGLDLATLSRPVSSNSSNSSSRSTSPTDTMIHFHPDVIFGRSLEFLVGRCFPLFLFRILQGLLKVLPFFKISCEACLMI